MAAGDAGAAAGIIHAAFREVAGRHGFPPSFPTLESARWTVDVLLSIDVIHGLVAEEGERVLGILFLDEGDEIRAIAVVAVDPAAQGRGIGRRLMEAALARAGSAAGVRLVQEAYNVQALALYASLGFAVREPLARVAGRPRRAAPAGTRVRPLGLDDLEACARLCRQVHGIERTADLRDGIRLFSAAYAVERAGRITACTYAFSEGHLAWGVAETEDDMRALLLGVASERPGPITLLLPTRQASLFAWCLAEGWRVEKPLTLMARGLYHEPRGIFFPSGFY